MKPAFTRRYRRHNTPVKTEGSFFKKESQETFFGSSHESFFSHAAITPTVRCKSEQEINTAPKDETKKEDEEKRMRAEDKKEEKELQRQPEKEEGKKLQRAEESNEEEPKLQKKDAGINAAPANITFGYINSLNGKGQPLPKQQQYFFGRRMGHDFSKVKVHNGTAAADSAEAVNAKAYTVGNDIVFNEGQYNTESAAGKKLLAHELTHVVQQSNGVNKKLQRQPNPLPDVTQGDFDSCGAASIITAILIADGQDTTATSPNRRFVAACNIVLTYFAQHPMAIRTSLERSRNSTPAEANTLYNQLVQFVTAARNNANSTGATVGNGEYRALAVAIYALHVQRSGLDVAAISTIRSMLGMESGSSQGGIQSFDALMSSGILQGLLPGQIAQVGWYVETSRSATSVSYGHHAFLIGRLNDGTWYLHDQGAATAVRLTGLTLSNLRMTIAAEAAAGRYWIFTGNTSQFSRMAIGGWTGVALLNSADNVVSQRSGLIASGLYLGEVDAGAFTIGDGINAETFVSEHYDLPSARIAAAGISGKGAVIIEMPQGVFVVYSTNQIREPNKMESGLDASGGGNLTSRRFFHAWLQLRAPSGPGSFFSVY